MARTKKSEDSVKEVKYEHYVKPVKILENFEEIYKLKYHLISSYDELLDFYNNKFDPNSFLAWDTETTDLNPEKGKLTDDLTEGRIVGYSFTQNGNDGYYVPLTHPDIAIGYKGLKVLYAMVSRSKLNLLYNARFDMRFLEHMTPEKYDYIPEPGEKIYPFDLSKIKYFDVQCSVWLSDTNVPMPSLKKSEKHFLGWNPPTFADTMGDETNFGYIPAEQGYRYACIDALGTYHLFFKTEKYYTESGAAGKLDNEVLYPLMKLENTPIYVDHEYLKKMRVDIVKHLAELKQYLYDKIGIEYNINSGRELVAVFQQLGIDTGQRTATGIMKTDIKTIDNYLVEHNDNSENGEYLRKLVEYKKLTKFDNSYLEKLIKVSSAEEVNKHPIRFNYFTARVPCLTENNRVLIKDKGLVSIKDCKSGDYIWTQYGYKKVLWNNSHFANDIYKVTFKNGYTIEGTGHHPVLVNKTGRSTYLKYEWAGLADLKPGEHIVLNHKPCENYNTDIEYDFARLIGFIDGNGSIATQDRVKLCYWTGESNELKEYYGNLLSKYSNSELHYDLSQEESHHAIVQAVYNTKFNTYLHSLGVRGDGVPKCILNSSPKIWLAYLQGIWDSDGNISLHNDNRRCPQVGIKLIKKQTVRDIGLMLLMLGIPNSLLDINYYKDKPNYHEQLRCHIRDHIGYVLFKNLISDYMKSNKRLKFESLNIDNNYIEYAQTTVKSIEKIEDTIVYDIEVEDVHEYIANGIVTHNTGRLACFTENCLVHTKQGLIKIKNINDNYDIEISTDKYAKANVLNIGVKPIYKVQLSNGKILEITNDHRFLVPTENGYTWKYVKDMSINDRICLTEVKFNGYNINKLCWLYGFFLGDGSCCDTKYKERISLSFGPDDIDAKEYVKSIFDELNLKYYEKIIKSKVVNGKDNYVINLYGENYRKFKDIFNVENTPQCKRSINFDLIHSKEDAFSVVAGFYQAEGEKHIRKSDGKMNSSAVTTSEQLARDIQSLCDYIGIRSRIYIKKNGFAHNKQKYIWKIQFLIKSFRKYLDDSIKYRINTHKYVDKFIFDELNELIKDKNNFNDISAYNKLKTYMRKQNKCSLYSVMNINKYLKLPIEVYDFANITNIEYIGEKEVYTLYVNDDSHRYIADGVINHNCGTDGKNTFFSPINFQSLPKPHSHNYHVHKATLEQIANNEDLCGYIFNDDPENSIGITEGQDPRLNVRKAFVPKPNEDAVIVSVDMKAEELRLAANIYKEPTWINAFNTGQDVHKATALRIFGEDKYCKEARKKAKTANFGILYGSSAYGFHHQFPDMTLEECEDFIDKFKSALPSIEAAQNGAIRFGRKNGYVKTYFGRPRRVKYYFNSSNRSMQNFGKRTCMNTQVQGCAGDALKLMLIRLWKELFVPYKDKGVRWIGTIHDEINVLVPKYLLKEVVPIIMKCQTIKLPDWPVTIEPDLSIGTSFGSLIPWNIIYNDDGTVKEFIPQMDEIKEKDLHPGDPVEKDNYIPEVVEDNYDYMQ